MEGKPFAIIETDGHAGDAGTKTRVEAFLHCVREDQRSSASEGARRGAHPGARRADAARDRGARQPRARPAHGPGGGGARGRPEGLRRGRRGAAARHGGHDPARPAPHERQGVPADDGDARLAPRAHREGEGPHASPSSCRARTAPAASACTGSSTRWCSRGSARRGASASGRRPTPTTSRACPPGMGAIVLGGLTAYGLLADATRDTRPVERSPGAADAVHARWSKRLFDDHRGGRRAATSRRGR